MGFSTIAFLVLLSLKLSFAVADSDDNQRQNLIILLIDGYGAKLVNQTDSKLQDGLTELIKNGVRADLKPVFPTQSYPNWHSLATGNHLF
jgi:predicted AlkP superfamily pyrophosphatase or phosphodiesterase